MRKIKSLANLDSQKSDRVYKKFYRRHKNKSSKEIDQLSRKYSKEYTNLHHALRMATSHRKKKKAMRSIVHRLCPKERALRDLSAGIYLPLEVIRQFGANRKRSCEIPGT
jgi:hypothetical protein